MNKLRKLIFSEDIDKVQ